MTSELRAAAELILTCDIDEIDAVRFVDGEDQPCGPEFLDAAMQCARAVMGEHPSDDDEPVTREWLESLGFTDNGCDGLDLSAHNSRCGTVSLVVWHSSGEFFIDGSTANPQPDTCRDVRNLLAALKGG